jgi:hypothetical protein
VKSLVPLVALTGCGVTAATLRVTHVDLGENVEAQVPHGLERAPADHAVVDWPSGGVRCGRVTPIHVTHTTYTFTPVMRFAMGFFGGGEALAGATLLATAKGQSSTLIAGGVILGDAALALAGIFLFGQRAEVEEYERYGLAYQCHPGDGIAIGDRVAPLAPDGGLSAEDRAALHDELAAGKPLRLVVDRKLVSVPPEPSGQELVTLTRVPAIVKLPMLPDVKR